MKSKSKSAALEAILYGKTYAETARKYGLTRSAVQLAAAAIMDRNALIEYTRIIPAAAYAQLDAAADKIAGIDPEKLK